MSAIKVISIAFNANNPAGTYVTGDVVDIYYDASLDTSPSANPYAGLIVKLNDTPITSGSDIDWNTVSYKTVVYYHPLICNQGYQVQTINDISFFPYGLNAYLSNVSACSSSAVVCDLIFSPNISVTGASTTTSNDGSISVVATSSNLIKYKIGSDFDYYDGTGVSSGVFSFLTIGSYRIYARDNLNCGANILINLTVNNTYGVIYTISYKNLAGHSSKIDILKRAYVGATTDMVCGDIPISLEMRNESNLDKFQPIVSTQATIQLMAQIDKQYQELFTNDPKQYQIAFYKDVSGGTSYSLQWIGFVVPQIYQEEYLIPPYVVTVSATDALTNLSNLAFVQDDGQKFFGSIRVMSLISTILKKTNLSLPIRCACNLFANAMAQTATDDPLDQAYIDVETYYIAINGPSFDFVLRALLKPFRARLIQAEGRWNIVRVEEMIDSFSYRDFDADGVYVTHGSYNPIIDIKSAISTNRLRWSDQDQNLEIRPGFGKMRVNYHLGYKDNILRNGDFSVSTQWNDFYHGYTYQINLYGFQVISPSYTINSSYELITPGNLDNVALILSALNADIISPFGYIQSDNYLMAMGISNTIKISINVKCPSAIKYSLAVDGSGNTVLIPNKITPYYQKVRMRVYYGGKYLLGDGTWTNIPSDVIFYNTQFDQYVNFELNANWPDATYTTPKTFYLKVFQSVGLDYDFSTVAALQRKITNSTVAAYNNRGNYDASTGVFPSTGGSGGGGSIVAGDLWTVNVAGSIYGVYCIVTTRIRCINSTPGQSESNWLIGEITLSEGTKTEVHDPVSYGGLGLFYYELKNNTDSPSIPTIIRPNDYNVGTNPYQWVLIKEDFVLDDRESNYFFINKVQVQYLDNGQTPFDTIVRDVNGEQNNNVAVEDDIYHGSLSNIIINENITALVSNVLNPQSGTGFILSNQFPNNKTIFPNLVSVQVNQNILSGKLIYTGYFRDSSGNGYDQWARVGISESDVLHSIFLKTTIAQYNRSWKKITGSLYGDVFLSFLKVLKENLEDDIIYLPASMSYDDKQNKINGEFLELIDIYANPGSNGTLISPFISGFSGGFGG